MGSNLEYQDENFSIVKEVGTKESGRFRITLNVEKLI